MKFKYILEYETEDPVLISFLQQNDLGSLFRWLADRYIQDLWTVLETPDLVTARTVEET